MNTILIVWPTVRPDLMASTYAHWRETSRHPERVSCVVGTNGDPCIIRSKYPVVHKHLGPACIGPSKAVHKLSRSIPDTPDIIVVATDDFYSPKNWDVWLDENIQESCVLVVRDGIHTVGARIVTIPILSRDAFSKLGRIITHPDYYWGYADNELYENAAALGILKEMRSDSDPVFEHRHYTLGRRRMDSHDRRARLVGRQDEITFERRMKLSISERLIVKEDQST